MKQKTYSDKQKLVLEILATLRNNFWNCDIDWEKAADLLKKEYGIEEPYLTIKQYIERYSCGAHLTFTFNINGKTISVEQISDFLNEDIIDYYKLLSNYYVVDTERQDRGDFRAEYYLIIEPKED